MTMWKDEGIYLLYNVNAELTITTNIQKNCSS